MNRVVDKYCYLCSKKLVNDKSLVDEENTALDHGEHIFQQAIGGTLIVKGILCSSCGNKLGKEIDAPFLKQFVNITSRLYFHRDRAPKSYKKIKSNNGIMNFMGKSILVYAKGPDIYPVTPSFFERENQVFVIIKEDTSNEYVDKIVKPSFANSNDLEFIIIKNLKGMGVVYFEHNLDNRAFNQGFAKIAIGFAVSKGIDKKYLNKVLDIDNQKINETNKLNVIPYFPTTYIEKCIEKFRFLTEDPASLFHSIKLINIEKSLIAYIEIFGVYQVSIWLSDCYEGDDIYETYTQPLFIRKSDNLTYMPYREDYQINYEHKLSDETKQKIDIQHSGENLEYILNLMNQDIVKYDRNEAKKIDIDKYYSDLLKHLGNVLTCLEIDEKEFKHKIYKSYASVVRQKFPSLCEEESFYDSVRILCFFIKNPELFKLRTIINDTCVLAIEANFNYIEKHNDLLKEFLKEKFEDLELFMYKYLNKNIEEGKWKIYPS